MEKKAYDYDDSPQPSYGIWLNQDRELFKNKDLRYAFAHAINIEKVIEKVLWNDYERLEQGFLGYGKYSNTLIKARRFGFTEMLKEVSGFFCSFLVYLKMYKSLHTLISLPT